MPDYKAMYYRMAGKVADAIDLLIQAQQDGELSATEEDKELFMCIDTEDGFSSDV